MVFIKRINPALGAENPAAAVGGANNLDAGDSAQSASGPLSTTSSASTTSDGDSSSRVIAGGAGAGVVIVIVAVLTALFVAKRVRQRKQSNAATHEVRIIGSLSSSKEPTNASTPMSSRYLIQNTPLSSRSLMSHVSSIGRLGSLSPLSPQTLDIADAETLPTAAPCRDPSSNVPSLDLSRGRKRGHGAGAHVVEDAGFNAPSESARSI